MRILKDAECIPKPRAFSDGLKIPVESAPEPESGSKDMLRGLEVA